MCSCEVHMYGTVHVCEGPRDSEYNLGHLCFFTLSSTRPHATQQLVLKPPANPLLFSLQVHSDSDTSYHMWPHLLWKSELQSLHFYSKHFTHLKHLPRHLQFLVGFYPCDYHCRPLSDDSTTGFMKSLIYERVCAHANGWRAEDNYTGSLFPP